MMKTIPMMIDNFERRFFHFVRALLLFLALYGLPSAVLAQEEPDIIPVSHLLGSTTTDATCPVQYVIDGSLRSAWSLSPGSGEGWVEFRFPASYLVAGVRISGTLDAGDGIRFMYRENGVWKPFFSGITAGPVSGDFFVNLAFDHIVSDSVRMYLDRSGTGTTAFSEISCIGGKADSVSRRLDVKRFSTTEHTSIYYPADNLFDGNTRTYWRTLFGTWNREDENLFGKYSGAEIVHASWFNPGEVIAYFDGPVKVERLRVYLAVGFTGRYSFSLRTEGGSWVPAGELRPGSECGWIELETVFPEDRYDAMKVSADGYFDGLWGLAEVEAWGTGAWQADKYAVAHPIGRDEAGTNAVYEAYVDRPSAHSLEILYPRTDAVDPVVELNGLPPGEPVLSDFLHYRVLSYPVGVPLLVSGVNYLTISASDTSGIECRIRTENRDGRIPVQGLSGGRFIANSDGRIDLELKDFAALERITVYSASGVSPGLSVLTDEGWRPVPLETYLEHFSSYVCCITSEKLRLSGLVPGSAYELTVSGSPVTRGLPVVRFLNPVDGSCVDERDLSKTHVVGFTDVHEGDIWVNGKRADRKGNFFLLPCSLIPLLNRYPETLTAKLVLRDGTEIRESISVYIGESKSFSVDQSGTSYTDKATFTVTGTVQNRNYRITSGGTNAKVSGRRFSLDVPIKEGFNLLRIRCTDRQGRVLHTVFLNVIRYGGEPLLTIFEPADRSYTRDAVIPVRGYASGMGKLSVTVNGKPAERIDGIFVFSGIELVEGVNTISVRVQAENGKSAERSVSVILDSTPAPITDLFPADGYISSTSSVDFNVTAPDSSPVWVFVNGTVCTFRDEAYRIRHQFPDSHPLITVTTIDVAGNRAETVYRITVDTTLPLPFTVAADPAVWTNNIRPVVGFSTTDATSGIGRYECILDDGSAAIVTSPYRLPPLEDGIHTIIIHAIDRAGWVRPSSTQVFIDTIPPVTPSWSNLIPGDGVVEVLWSASDPDTIEYSINRTTPGGQAIERHVPASELSFKDTSVKNGTEYSYTITAVDRAYNLSSPTSVQSIRAGIELEPYASEAGATAEYKGVKLIISGGGLPPGSEAVTITEVESEVFEAEALSPLVGPVYRIEVLDGTGTASFGTATFDRQYVCSFAYDPTDLPRGFSEENLGIYYFDTLFGKWIRIRSCAVDTGTDTIWFSSDHFTFFSIQATAVQEPDPGELQNIGYSPFRTYARHDDLSVATQGGTALTSAQELVLPGPAGFDLILKRRYDFSIAQTDGRVFGVNWALPYARSQADIAYSCGQGWRLDLPYIKDGTDEPQIVLPGGSTYSFYDLEKPVSEMLSDGCRSLAFEHHGDTDFTLMVVYGPEVLDVSTVVDISSVPLYRMKSASLRLRDGSSYEFDELGRVTVHADPAGINRIAFLYAVGNGGTGVEVLSCIQDSTGRYVDFSYEVKNNLPVISKISVRNDHPYNRIISYSHDEKGLLVSVTDAGRRLWTYAYAEYVLDGSKCLFPLNLRKAVLACGYENIVARLDRLDSGDNSCTVNALSGLQGPGKGIINIYYMTKYFEAQKHRRIYAHQVSTFASGIDFEAGFPIRRTTYDYTFETRSPGAVEGEENKPEDDQILITGVAEIEEDGLTAHTRNIYHYSVVEKLPTRWTVNVFDDRIGRPEDGKTTPVALTRLSRIEHTVSSGDNAGRTLSGETVTYPDGSSVRPASRFSFIGFSDKGSAASSEEIFAYDVWGNLVRHDETTRTSVRGEIRTNRVIRYSLYNGTTGDPLSEFDWYAALSRPAPAPNVPAKDLLLAQTVITCVPSYAVSVFGTGGETGPERRIWYEYNGLGQKKSENRGEQGTDRFIRTAFLYDNERSSDPSAIARGNVIEIVRDHILNVDGTAHTATTKYTYDESGFPSSSTEKDLALKTGVGSDIGRTYSYEKTSGWKISETDPRGYVTEYAYDGLGRIIRVVHPDEGDLIAGSRRADNPSTDITYDDRTGTLSSEVVFTADAGVTRRNTLYDFNDRGTPVKITRKEWDAAAEIYESAAVTTLTYNRHGIASITDPNGNAPGDGSRYEHTTSFTYDELGRQRSIAYPDDTESDTDNPRKFFLFDYSSSTLTTVDENGYESENEISGHKTVEVRDYAGRTLFSYRYDGVSTDPIEISTFYDGEGREVGKTGPRAGEITRNEYDAYGRLVKVVSSEREVFEPVSVGDLTAVGKKTAPVVVYEYSASGYLSRKIAPLPDEGNEECSLITEYDVNALGWILRETRKKRTGPAEMVLSAKNFEFDAAGNPIAVTDENGFTVRSTFNAAGKVLSRIEADGTENTWEYYADGNVRKSLDARYNSGAYDGILDENDFKAEYFYDDLGRLTRTELPPKQPGGTRVSVNFSYDRRGNLLSRVDPDGRRTMYSFYPGNRPETETLSWNDTEYVTRYAYDKVGNVVSVTDPRNNIETREYDTLGRLLKTVRPEGDSVTLTYDKAGNRLTEKDGKGNTTRYEYDLANSLVRTGYPENNGTETFSYNRCGLITKHVDPEGRARFFDYYPEGRLKNELDPLGGIITCMYDPAGNLTGKLDQNGTVFTYDYTPTNLLSSASATNGAGTEIVTYTYDEAGNPETATNGSVTVRYNFSSSDGTFSYTPDPYGRIVSKTTVIDGRTFTTEYDYDAGDRVGSLTYPNGRTVVYTWNPLGELTAMDGFLQESPVYEGGILKSLIAANSVGEIFSCDRNTRLTAIDRTGASGKITSYAYGYDDAGNIAYRINADGKESTYFYDGMNRLTAAAMAGVFTADTDNEDKLLGESRSDTFGTKPVLFTEQPPVTRTVDGVRLLDLDLASGSIGVDLLDTYEVPRLLLTPLNPDNRVTPDAVRIFVSADNEYSSDDEITDAGLAFITEGGRRCLEIRLPAGTFGRFVKVKTDFDERSFYDFSPVNLAEFFNEPERLITVYYLVRSRNEAYGYDRTGNRTALSVRMVGTDSSIFRYYPDSSRLLTDGTYAYTYDAAGNLTAKSTHVLVSSVPTSVDRVPESVWASSDMTPEFPEAAPGERILIRYEYDPFGRLVRIYRNGEMLCRYAYDADGLRILRETGGQTTYYSYDLQDRLLYEETDGSAALNVYLDSRLFALEEFTAGEPESKRLYCHTDNIGSVTALTDSSGIVIWNNEYTPFGALYRPGEREDAYRNFTGKDYDTVSGMYYFNSRWYDPETGRFITEDPARDGVNWYAYCGNNPLAFVDPTGMEQEDTGPEDEYGFLKNRKTSGFSSEAGGNNGAQKSDFSKRFRDSWGDLWNGFLNDMSYQAENTRNYFREHGVAGGIIDQLHEVINLIDLSSVRTVEVVDPKTGEITTMQIAAPTFPLLIPDVTAPGKRSTTIGFHATSHEAAEAIQQGGFRLGTKPGRLGSGGVYVNNTAEGAVAEFTFHNPGVTPSILEVEYKPGINALAVTSPLNYVMQIPLNVNSITAESLRLPGTFNTNILNGSAVSRGILP